ncbi:MAG: hypothetical protein ACOZBH_01475 [Patescibacteria group bacterium]
MAEVKRKRGESFESFLRRFSRKLFESGKLIQYKKVAYHSRQKSRNLQKQSALIRNKIRIKRDYLKKIGRLPEEENTYRRRR